MDCEENSSRREKGLKRPPLLVVTGSDMVTCIWSSELYVELEKLYSNTRRKVEEEEEEGEEEEAEEA